MLFGSVDFLKDTPLFPTRPSSSVFLTLLWADETGGGGLKSVLLLLFAVQMPANYFLGAGLPGAGLAPGFWGCPGRCAIWNLLYPWTTTFLGFLASALLGRLARLARLTRLALESHVGVPPFV